MCGCGKDCLILIPSRLPQLNSFTLSLKCFSSDSDNCPSCGDRTPASVPPPAEGRSSPTNTPIPLLVHPTEFCVVLYILWPSLVAQMVKRLPTMRETWVRPLGQEDPLKKEMAAHSSILAWKIPRTEELGWLLSMGSQRVGHG